MSTSVTITGTGCPIPNADRAGPGVLVRYDDMTMQFDAGRATVQRLAGADVWIPELDLVCITHHHSDHLTGLADLVLTYWVMDRTDARPPLPIVVPSGPGADYVRNLLHSWKDDIDIRAAHSGRANRPGIDLIEFETPEVPTEVWRRGDVIVSAGPVRHEPCLPAVGYRVDTPDGSLAITGDTRVCDEVAVLAEGVDVLVYEAMRYSFFDDLPPHRQFVKEYHADAPMIGAQAAELGIPKLILTHLIPAPITESDRQEWVDEVRSGGFEGELIVADDLFATAVGSAGMPQVDKVTQAANERP